MRYPLSSLLAVLLVGLPSCAVGVDDTSASNPWGPADGGAFGGQGGSAGVGGQAAFGGAAGWPATGGTSSGGEAGMGEAGTAGFAGTGTAGAAGGTGNCVPGEIMNLGACANCGTSRRTCDPYGLWGEPECTGQGVCSPGETEPQDCANCGVKTRSCGNDCTWGSFGACQGQGTCSPGAKRDCMCSTYNTTTACCGEEVCTNACQWGACKLKSTSACDWKAGTNFRCCAAGKWEYCLSNCNWSGNCASCTSCGC